MNFKIEHLDHVAIRSVDMGASIKWYEKVLGLVRHQLPKWGDFPIFMLAGKTGIAIFPANHPSKMETENAGIDHFAFSVSNKDFNEAQIHFTKLGIEFTLKDHHYFHSVYIKDPDGHDVELTTLVVEEKEVYKNV
jgi:catechol 2,3-dioxygenase-like lactoylglutathione lyase family enzyme